VRIQPIVGSAARDACDGLKLLALDRLDAGLKLNVLQSFPFVVIGKPSFVLLGFLREVCCWQHSEKNATKKPANAGL
jgi:hypothetical protein